MRDRIKIEQYQPITISWSMADIKYILWYNIMHIMLQYCVLEPSLVLWLPISDHLRKRSFSWVYCIVFKVNAHSKKTIIIGLKYT